MPDTVAIYLRFSNDDGSAADSESIRNQRDLLRRFITEHDELYDMSISEFADDGYTGMNFQRPGFKNMMNAIKRKEVSCIVVKDFSRFGRNFIDVSDYLDQIFPFLGVRFIAVNEHYDSKTTNATMGLDMSLKNLIYDMYSKDLGKKIRSARKTLAKKGEYIAPFALYGYAKSLENKKKLVVDPPAAKIVTRIFDCAANGEKPRAIAIGLNNDGELPPNEYHKSKSGKKKHYVTTGGTSAPLWTADSVRKILKDERYTGNMICGRYVTSIVGGKRKVVDVPREDWAVTLKAHEAIVSDELFAKAQKVLGTRKQTAMPSEPRSVLVGWLTCGYCGKRLVFDGKYNPKFYCHNQNMGLRCERATTGEQALKDAIFAAIQKQLSLVELSERSAIATAQAKADVNSQIRILKRQLKKLKLEMSLSLEQYLDGSLSKETYLSTKTDATHQLHEAEKELGTLVKAQSDVDEFSEQHRSFYNTTELSRDMLDAMVEKIVVHSAESIEIAWKYAETYAKLLEASDG